MARNAASYMRQGARYAPEPMVIVICEDRKSSRTYLQEAAVFYRSSAKILVTHCGRTDPMGIVEEAIKYLKTADQVYCAIDRDTHDHFDEALAHAASNSVKTIVSYPCYEYWLLLHFRYTRAPYSRAGNRSAGDCVVADLTRCEGMKDYAKGGSEGLFKALLGRLDVAKAHAVRASAAAEAEQEKNPSTNLHSLLDAIEALGEPKRLS